MEGRKKTIAEIKKEDKIKFFLDLLDDYHNIPSKEFDKKYGTTSSFIEEDFYLLNEYKKIFSEELEK